MSGVERLKEIGQGDLMQRMDTVQNKIDEVVSLIDGSPEAGVRILLADYAIEKMRKAQAALGAYGVRGAAAVQLISETGSAKNAAEFIAEFYGADISPSALNRMAGR